MYCVILLNVDSKMKLGDLKITPVLCFIQMKPDVEIFFSDIADTMKKQNRQLIQVIMIV